MENGKGPSSNYVDLRLKWSRLAATWWEVKWFHYNVARDHHEITNILYILQQGVKGSHYNVAMLFHMEVKLILAWVALV